MTDIASRLAAVTGVVLLVSPLALAPAASADETAASSAAVLPASVAEAVLLSNDGALPAHGEVAVITAAAPAVPALPDDGELADETAPDTLASLIDAASVTELGTAVPAGAAGSDLIPAEFLGGDGSGLTAEYFTSTDVTQEAALQEVHASTVVRLPVGAVATRLSGQLQVPVDGTYEFTLTATGGARMLVDGTEVATLEPPETEEDAATADKAEAVASAVPTTSVSLELTGGTVLPVQVEMVDETSPEPVLTWGWRPPAEVVSTAVQAAVEAAAGADTVLIQVPALPARESGDETQAVVPGSLPLSLATLVALLAASTTRVVVVEDAVANDDELPDLGAAALLHVPTGSVDLDTLARLVTGELQPGGALDVALPLPHGPPSTNDQTDAPPLYPVGHGLSYWTYRVLSLAATDVTSADVEVAATGTAPGSTSIHVAASTAGSEQLYPVGSATIAMGPTENQSVTVPLDLSALDLDSPDAWPITLHAGTSPDELTATTELTASDTPQAPAARSDRAQKQPKQGGVVMPAVPGLTLSTGSGAVMLENAVTVDGILRLTGTLPTVSVSDARPGNHSGWTVSARASDLAGPGGPLPASNLGWIPSVLTPTDGVVAGPAVASSLSGGKGLSDSAVLGRATTGGGTVQFGADFLLEAPSSTAPGSYSGTLTVTLFPLEEGPQS